MEAHKKRHRLPIFVDLNKPHAPPEQGMRANTVVRACHTRWQIFEKKTIKVNNRSAPMPKLAILSYLGLYLYLIIFKKYEIPVAPLLPRAGFVLFEGYNHNCTVQRNIKKSKNASDQTRSKACNYRWAPPPICFFVFFKGQNHYFTVQKRKKTTKPVT